MADTGRMGERVGVVLAVGVAGVGRLDERERRRLAVDGDRVDGQVRAVGVGVRALEVEAEVGQALGRELRQDDVVAGQELVGGRVVGHVDVGVDARVAAVAEIGVQAVAGMRQRAGARRAGGALGGTGRGWAPRRRGRS